jgi:sugar phosphate isomerase/epimerase
VTLRFGYGSNGFGSHRLDDALGIIADLGYDGVALTLDQPHLDPFDPDLPRRTAEVAGRLDRLGLSVVVETGARYVLDPWHKHEPTFVSEHGRSRRVDYLRRAVRVAAELGAEAVSFWSGTLPAGTSADTGWERLVSGVVPVLEEAQRYSVVCAFEPEPGMFVDRLDGVLELRRRLGDPDLFQVTLDLGHCVCVEDGTTAEVVRRTEGILANVQVDDMVPEVHEHLELGDGDLHLPDALGALLDVSYTGLAAMELPRHGHAAPAVAARSIDVLREALAVAQRERSASTAGVGEGAR